MRPMFYGSYHEIENLSNLQEKKDFILWLEYICETDTFGSNRKIREIKEGDHLVFKNAGLTVFQCLAIIILDINQKKFLDWW